MHHLLTSERPSKASEPFLKTPACCCVVGCACTKVEAGWLLEQSIQEPIMTCPGSNNKSDWQVGSGCTLKGRTSKIWQIMSCGGTSQGDSSVLALRNFTDAENISQAVKSVSRTCLRFEKQEKTKLCFGHFNGSVKFAIRPTGQFSQKQPGLEIKLGCGLYVINKNLNIYSGVVPCSCDSFDIGGEIVPEHLESRSVIALSFIQPIYWIDMTGSTNQFLL